MDDRRRSLGSTIWEWIGYFSFIALLCLIFYLGLYLISGGHIQFRGRGSSWIQIGGVIGPPVGIYLVAGVSLFMISVLEDYIKALSAYKKRINLMCELYIKVCTPIVVLGVVFLNLYIK